MGPQRALNKEPETNTKNQNEKIKKSNSCASFTSFAVASLWLIFIVIIKIESLEFLQHFFMPGISSSFFSLFQFHWKSMTHHATPLPLVGCQSWPSSFICCRLVFFSRFLCKWWPIMCCVFVFYFIYRSCCQCLLAEIFLPHFSHKNEQLFSLFV